jgi:hypothetical protein
MADVPTLVAMAQAILRDRPICSDCGEAHTRRTFYSTTTANASPCLRRLPGAAEGIAYRRLRRCRRTAVRPRRYHPYQPPFEPACSTHRDGVLRPSSAMPTSRRTEVLSFLNGTSRPTASGPPGRRLISARAESSRDTTLAGMVPTAACLSGVAVRGRSPPPTLGAVADSLEDG